ncbi:acetyl esterase [Jatrophihabitans endophyticus]|uniref:Acetyl esterase n=1 Tax=Jatrophihabitans endophyticus TaxID=1206085 RepID=A0A1M5H878_9ACTN|nr:alpha/beta hydrolase fold domain-containing protein [Jatrophihabitans endophyticus]SHG12115.1 acetyl esterase [Jatrophihabitans endophyticus]
MGWRHDLAALVAQRARPRYGRELCFAGQDLPAPARERVTTRHGRVRCLVYRGTRPGRYLHLHGGAFVTRHPRMDDFWARFVVARTGLTVVLADYDVAPQARFPVAHDEAFDIARHLASDEPLVVGGFSGGGNLAASVALRARGEFPLAGQLLGVPSLDVAEDARGKCAAAPGGMIGESLLTLVRETYFRDPACRIGAVASPLLAPDVTGAPPTLVVTAERDTLRREGDRYAARLRDAGVATEHVVAPGVDHYFLHGAGADAARALMTRMATWLASAAH